MNRDDTSNHTIYDSANGSYRQLIFGLRKFPEVVGLIKILVHKDLVSRYQRSILGLWWGLVNPTVMAVVLFYVFHSAYANKFEDKVPFGPYVLSGTLIINFLAHGILNTAQIMQSSSAIFTRLPAPPILFALSGSITNSINFVFGLVPLIFWNELASNNRSLTRLVVLPLLLIIGIIWVTGFSLLSFYFITRFGDAVNLIALFASISTFLTPVFYPINAVSARAQILLNLNPLTHFVNVYRWSTINYGEFRLVSAFVILLSSIVILLVGILVFKKSWPRTASLL